MEDVEELHVLQQPETVHDAFRRLSQEGGTNAYRTGTANATVMQGTYQIELTETRNAKLGEELEGGWAVGRTHASIGDCPDPMPSPFGREPSSNSHARRRTN